MSCNHNFDSQYPLTHESAAKMVADQHAAKREGEQRAHAALKATGGDKFEALKLLLGIAQEAPTQAQRRAA